MIGIAVSDEHGHAVPALVPVDSILTAVMAPAELRVADALMRCVGRWGLAKTTIPDIAREAGVSRATVYRLFPGGRSSILYTAVRVEVQRLLALLTAEAAEADSLEDCLVQGMHHAAVFLESHAALTYLRDHERAELDQVLSFERMDVLYVVSGAVTAPVFERFLAPEDAMAAGTWAARLVVSYLAEPADDVDLCDVDDVRTIVRRFMLPGLTRAAFHP